MPLILSGNVASATASTTYDVANSCRFNDGDSAAMSRDQSANDAGTNTKGTLSVWLKMSAAGTEQVIYTRETDASNYFKVWFENDKLLIQTVTSGSVTMKKETNRVFRDPGAWLNIVVILDSTDGTAGDRQQIWINGTRETSFANSTNIGSSANLQINTGTGTDYIGRRGSGNYYDGYMAEFVWIDGTDYAATSFGEYNEDSPNIWQPIDVSGLTFGTNGFYLDFEASDNLGNDANGGTDLTEANLAAVDQCTDSPTNNFATWNSLIYSNGSTAQANASYTTSNSSSNYGYRLSTIGVASGKWYAEVKYTSSSNQALIGIRSREATGVSHYLGYYDDDYAIYVDGHYYNNNSETTNSNASWTNGDIIGIFLDLDNNKLYFSKNGALYSSTGISITAAASTETGFYFFSASEWNSSGNGTFELNTGNPSFTLSSAVNDGDYGNFEYTTTITGDGASKTFKALNTKNLAEYG